MHDRVEDLEKLFGIVHLLTPFLIGLGSVWAAYHSAVTLTYGIWLPPFVLGLVLYERLYQPTVTLMYGIWLTSFQDG